ncbi:MAG: penicillin-binding protein 2 [Chloroflexi bacterium]|nr:MAG: penicillin-binding protein 2 [Chloroflexota bacterium]MBL1196733.1 penicillin-binding protein 2 [Chloroflexota bacterium]NOH14027.1 penicillin-binding protein 2 [Chloroflexota bacterium]
MRPESNWRYMIVGIAFAIGGLFIIGQTVRVQVIPSSGDIIEGANVFAGHEQIIYPVRGQIYDRWGNVLAANKTVYEIGVDLRSVQSPEDIALVLSGLLEDDYDRLLALTSQEYIERIAVYNLLANFVSVEDVNKLRDMISTRNQAEAQGILDSGPNLTGLLFYPHLQRTYPEDDLASNVLGFVSQEGQGYFGVEEYYDDLLAGTPQKVWIPNDPNLVEELPEIPPGTDLVLTIDRNIQATVEDILDASVEEVGAVGGTIVVMHPQTGEILAMASTRRLDLNQYWNYAEVFPDPQLPFNTAVSKTFEPGSTFKILTMAAALDNGDVKPGTPFVDTGVIEIGGINIRNWNNAAWGPQTMTGCMQHSLNVCMAWLGQEMGADRYYEYLQNFGIGRNTGVDLAGESPGRLKIPGDGDWFPSELGTNTFGQGVSINMTQLMMATSSIINDGKMVTPHVVQSIVNPDNQYNITIQVAGEPLYKKTARQLNQMLTDSLVEEASDALVTGYSVAGKTGTSEIPTEFGYSLEQTHASFLGWGPVDDPQFMVYVWIEEPQTSPWGSVIAAPIFSEVVERLVVLMDIPPDALRASLKEAPVEEDAPEN